MPLDIVDSVGADMPDGSSSANFFLDILNIQYLLNQHHPPRARNP